MTRNSVNHWISPECKCKRRPGPKGAAVGHTSKHLWFVKDSVYIQTEVSSLSSVPLSPHCSGIAYYTPGIAEFASIGGTHSISSALSARFILSHRILGSAERPGLNQTRISSSFMSWATYQMTVLNGGMERILTMHQEFRSEQRGFKLINQFSWLLWRLWKHLKLLKLNRNIPAVGDVWLKATALVTSLSRH